MNRTINYLPCSIVCHGECELIFVKQIQIKKRRNLNPLSEKNGKQSILINTINHFLKCRFPDEHSYIRKNKDFLLIDNESKKIIKHKIFTIMDKDDTPDDVFLKYKSKELFKDFWWGKEDLIVPIYFDPNLDTVLIRHGFKIDSSKHKPAQYFKLMTTQYDEVIELLCFLDKKETNIKVLFEYLDGLKPTKIEDKTK